MPTLNETVPIVFEAFPKLPRLNRSMIVTEKVDGSNAAIIVTEDGAVAAQSRKRLLTSDGDLNGFGGWVRQNSEYLAATLGPGRHFGEWYGHKIQRTYGLDHKRFALFNVDRWSEVFPELTEAGDAFIHTVPVLYRGEFCTEVINGLAHSLREDGTVLPGAEGQPAEGVVVWHNAARQMFKVTCHADERPKSSQEPA